MNEFALPVEEVIAINRRIKREQHALDDRGALEGALARPLQTFGGNLLHPTLAEQAAALLQGVAVRHAFRDGNKRTAWVCTVTYLHLAGAPLRHMEDEEAGQLVLDMTTHALSFERVALALVDNMAI